MTQVATCLWFDRDGLEAAAFYTSLFPDSAILDVMHAPADYPAGKAGDPLLITFTLAGVTYTALNGHSDIPFSWAASIYVTVESQAEIDRLWAALTADGGEAVACGWCKDRFGLSWQIIPKRLPELLADPDPGRARRAYEAMMTMVKIDLAGLDRAAEGG